MTEKQSEEHTKKVSEETIEKLPEKITEKQSEEHTEKQSNEHTEKVSKNIEILSKYDNVIEVDINLNDLWYNRWFWLLIYVISFYLFTNNLVVSLIIGSIFAYLLYSFGLHTQHYDFYLGEYPLIPIFLYILLIFYLFKGDSIKNVIIFMVFTFSSFKIVGF